MFIIWLCWLLRFWKGDRELEVRTATYGPGIDQSQHAKSVSHIMIYNISKVTTYLHLFCFKIFCQVCTLLLLVIVWYIISTDPVWYVPPPPPPPLTTYLLLTECKVRTASYGQGCFLPFTCMAQARSAWAMKTRNEKTRIHNLPYGPSKRG